MYMYKRRAKGWKKHLDFIVLDVICMHISLVLAYVIRHGFHFVYSSETYRTLGLWMTVFCILIAIMFNTMHNVLRRGYGKEIAQTILQSGLVFSTTIIFLFAMKNSELVSRVTLWIHLGIYIVISYLVRLAHKHFVKMHVIKFGGRREMLLICDESIAEETVKNFNVHPEDAIHLLGIILINEKQKKTAQEEENSGIAGVPVVAAMKDAADYILREWIDEVYVAVADQTDLPVELLEQCGEMGVTIHIQLMQIRNMGLQKVERIADQNVLTGSIAMVTPGLLLIKRIMDIVGGLVLSFFALLAMAFVAVPLKKASPGPILYKSERIGQNGKRFLVSKFSSMRNGLVFA